MHQADRHDRLQCTVGTQITLPPSSKFPALALWSLRHDSRSRCCTRCKWGCRVRCLEKEALARGFARKAAFMTPMR